MVSNSFKKRLLVTTGGAIVSGFSQTLFGNQRRFKPIKHILAASGGRRGGGGGDLAKRETEKKKLNGNRC